MTPLLPGNVLWQQLELFVLRDAEVGFIAHKARVRSDVAKNVPAKSILGFVAQIVLPELEGKDVSRKWFDEDAVSDPDKMKLWVLRYEDRPTLNELTVKWRDARTVLL